LSDCPDCENEGFVWCDGGEDEGPLLRVRCTNWRHGCGPSLKEIADAIREGREPPRPYRKNPTGGGIEPPQLKEARWPIIS
jgi:hypothetical protein